MAESVQPPSRVSSVRRRTSCSMSWHHLATLVSGVASLPSAPRNTMTDIRLLSFWTLTWLCLFRFLSFLRAFGICFTCPPSNVENYDCALAMFVLPTVMQCASLSTVAAVIFIAWCSFTAFTYALYCTAACLAQVFSSIIVALSCRMVVRNMFRILTFWILQKPSELHVKFVQESNFYFNDHCDASFILL